MLDYVVELADVAGVRDRIVVVHADLGRVEWKGTRELAERQARHYGVRFEVVSRPQGDLLAQIEARGMFPSSTARYCTSDQKTGQVATLLTRLAAEVRRSTGRQARILNMLGIRAQESPARARKVAHELDRRASNSRREVVRWLPVFSWTEAEVWARIEASGVEHHFAYDLGMPRLSCCFCVLASEGALVLAARHNRELADEYVAVEARIGHRFTERLSMADIVAKADAGDAVAPEDWAPPASADSAAGPTASSSATRPTGSASGPVRSSGSASSNTGHAWTPTRPPRPPATPSASTCSASPRRPRTPATSSGPSSSSTPRPTSGARRPAGPARRLPPHVQAPPARRRPRAHAPRLSWARHPPRDAGPSRARPSACPGRARARRARPPAGHDDELDVDDEPATAARHRRQPRSSTLDAAGAQVELGRPHGRARARDLLRPAPVPSRPAHRHRCAGRPGLARRRPAPHPARLHGRARRPRDVHGE